MTFRVDFTPEAAAQLASVEAYIAANANSPVIAWNYFDAIVDYCESLAFFPLRGMCRDDLMPGLRITNYRGSTTIAFLVDVDTATVSILGVFYGGQDYEATFEGVLDT